METSEHHGETFAQLIARIKATYRVAEPEIARRIGVSTSTVNNWINGVILTPRVSALRKLADEFPKITADEIFNAVGRPAPGPLSPEREERLLDVFRRLTGEQQDFIETSAHVFDERNRSASS